MENNNMRRGLMREY